MLGSKFIGNTDLYNFNDPNLLKTGGAITFQGQNLYINNSYGQSNNGFRGGFLFVDIKSKKHQNIIIESSIFKDNLSGNGGVISFSNALISLNSTIKNNYFYNNRGASIFFYNLKKYN